MAIREIVQEIYAAFGRGDIQAILRHVSPDVSWEHEAIDHGIPWLTPGRGLDHVSAFFGVVQREVAIEAFEVQKLFVEGDEVIATIHIEFKVHSTGKRVRDRELHHWTFGRDGKVVRFRHVLDTHQHWLSSR